MPRYDGIYIKRLTRSDRTTKQHDPDQQGQNKNKTSACIHKHPSKSSFDSFFLTVAWWPSAPETAQYWISRVVLNCVRLKGPSTSICDTCKVFLLYCRWVIQSVQIHYSFYICIMHNLINDLQIHIHKSP